MGSKKEIIELVLKLENKIHELGFQRPPSENWIQFKDLESAIGIHIPNIMEILRSQLQILEPTIYHHMRSEFPISFNDTEQEWRIGDDNNHFAGSKSEGKIRNIQDLLKSGISEIKAIKNLQNS